MQKIQDMTIGENTNLEEAVQILGSCLHEAILMLQKYAPPAEFQAFRDSIAEEGVHFGERDVREIIPETGFMNS